MHTDEVYADETHDVRIHRNGDWSGSAILQWMENGKLANVSIPGWVAAALHMTDGTTKAVLRELATPGGPPKG